MEKPRRQLPAQNRHGDSIYSLHADRAAGREGATGKILPEGTFCPGYPPVPAALTDMLRRVNAVAVAKPLDSSSGRVPRAKPLESYNKCN